jgi:acetate kinase
MSVLALNTCSSSVKFGIFEDGREEALREGEVTWANGKREHAHLIVRSPKGRREFSTVSAINDETAATCVIRAALSAGQKSRATVHAVGHRIVHGGTQFRKSVLIDQKVKAAIADLSKLAPLHNASALKTIEVAETFFPGVPQIGVFDTAFFEQLPPKAFLYPIPYGYYKHWGIRRFGFHGISHAYCANRASELLNHHATRLELVICHLGGGCSALAVRDGVAVATTSGFSCMDGLMMGTRSGSLDPGIVLALQRQHQLTLDETEHALTSAFGLLGVSGISPDLADIERAADRGDERACLAFEMFADEVRTAIGGLAVTLTWLNICQAGSKILFPFFHGGSFRPGAMD